MDDGTKPTDKCRLFRCFEMYSEVLQLNPVLCLFPAILSGVFLKASAILVDIPHQKKKKR